MKDPKVGERVVGYEMSNRVVGTIEKILPSGTLQVRTLEEGLWYIFHHKQCRRLKKKERKRVWIHKKYFEESPLNLTSKSCCFSTTPVDGWLEFVEVRKK